MIFELKGVQFVNKGAELMLRVIVERLTTLMPGIEFAIAPGPNSPYRQIVKTGSLLRLRVGSSLGAFDRLTYYVPRRVRNIVRRHGTVMESDLDGVIDASGYAYGSLWGNHAMIQTSRELLRLAAREKPYVFMPQAFGPFDRNAVTGSFIRALRLAALVCARDAASCEALERASEGQISNLHSFPDFTASASGRASHPERWRIDRHTALIVPNIEMIGTRNSDSDWRDRYVELLGLACEEAKRLGYSVRVLNHEGSRDQELCERLCADNGLEPAINETDPFLLKGLIGAAGMVIGSRFHACVAALSQGVPCVGTAWSHKYRHLFDDYGTTQLLLEHPQSDAMRRMLREATDNGGPIRETLLRRQAILGARTEEMWQLVQRSLERRPSAA